MKKERSLLLAIASAVLPGLCLSTSMTLAQDGAEPVDLQLSAGRGCVGGFFV
jgi:hypothetical protein